MKQITACILMIALLPIGLTTARTWTSVSGAKLDAEYVGRDGPAILLKKANGAEIKIHINKLSETDQSFLETLEQPEEGSENPLRPKRNRP